MANALMGVVAIKFVDALNFCDLGHMKER
jgi:hypothetical protein